MSKYIDKDKVLEYIIFGVVGKDITCGELKRAIESIPTKEYNVECYARACKNNKNGKCEANNIILEFGCGDCDGR